MKRTEEILNEMRRYGKMLNDTMVDDRKQGYFVRVTKYRYFDRICFVTMVNGKVVDFKEVEER